LFLFFGVNGGDKRQKQHCLQTWRVAGNILNIQLRIRDTDWLSSLGVSQGANNVMLHRAFDLLYKFHSSPNIIKAKKSKMMRCAGHVERMGRVRNTYQIMAGKSELNIRWRLGRK